MSTFGTRIEQRAVKDWLNKPYSGPVFPESLHQAQVSFTTGGSANVKTAWVEVVATTSADVGLLVVDGRTFVSGAESSYLIDYAVGESGSETAIVENIYVGMSNGYAPRIVPIFIPAGSRLSARVQSNRTNDTRTIQTTFFGSSDNTLPVTVDVIGTNTVNSRATIVGSATTWTQITASTAKDYRQLILCSSVIGSSLTNGGSYRTLLGIGASGSEVTVAGTQSLTTDSELFTTPALSAVVLDTSGTPSTLTTIYTALVPAGTRLSFWVSPGGGGIAGGFIIGVPA